MLTNPEFVSTGARFEDLTRKLPEIGPLVDAVAKHPDPFMASDTPTGIEFAANRPVGSRANRARIKLFRVDEGPLSGRVAAFFYKQSQVPFSSDRHSYGVCLLPTDGSDPAELVEWVFFASTGFDPAARPRGLRQAFAFTVPD